MVDLIPTKEEWIAALEKRHGKEIQKKLSDGIVAICGLGGLGSTIAIALARAGIGKLVLIDFDRVDITNLHRQQYKLEQIGMLKADALAKNIQEIAPYTKIETHTARISEENITKLLGKSKIVCEAFDDAECKAMLANFILENMPDKYLIASSGMAGLESANAIKTRKHMKKFYVCGDGVSAVEDGIGLVSTRVMVCAAHQAHMVLRILTENYEV